MLNTGAMLAILTTITLDDYYTDQIQEKRQKMKNYADSMKSIGDNVRLWGGSITDTLRDSGRTDLEQSILQGAQELLIYIFAQVIRGQAGCLTKYQKRMIDIAFQNLNMLPFSREEYDQALRGDAKASRLMEETVGLSPEHCGMFWHDFIETMDAAQAGDDLLKTITDAYAQLVCDFSVLGEGDVSQAEAIYERFAGGLQSALQEYAETASLLRDPQLENALRAMRQNCIMLRDLNWIDDEILLDYFDFFTVAIYVGMMERLPVHEWYQNLMLQFLLDYTPVQCEDDAWQIHSNMEMDDNAKIAYYGMANDWDTPNFWVVHAIAATRAGRQELSGAFTAAAGDFIHGTERLLRRNFPDQTAELEGIADEYYMEVLGHLMEAVR